MLEQELAHLPEDVREQLAILELELSEGDITQKGYEKKRNLILGKFSKGCSADPGQSKGSPGARAHRQHQRRLTRDETRFHSEIRAEAVQQALAEYSQGYKERPSIVQPIKRSTESRGRYNRASDSSSDDDDSLVGSLKRKTQPIGKQNAGLGASRNGNSAPPDVTGGAAVEAMLRRVREQHEIKLQVALQIQRETDSRSKITSPKAADGVSDDVRGSKRIEPKTKIDDDVEQATRLIDEVVYVNQDCIKSSDGQTTPPNANNYQNAVFCEFVHCLSGF
ncbi:DMAP1-binding Domain protein [Necator americanus]|uniref:DMAP1-binding Domain protein n=1 Tax=Necator americanus TaxID=51031 RepID=W2TXW8_NECAM|nr:DMAP1-binding Domain protein [Necator americanus]ETN86524.1 DMAP1-binding Domain protein [Necator americanus]